MALVGAGDGGETLARFVVAHLVVSHHQRRTRIFKPEIDGAGVAVQPAEVVRSRLFAVGSRIQAAVHDLPVDARVLELVPVLDTALDALRASGEGVSAGSWQDLVGERRSQNGDDNQQACSHGSASNGPRMFS